MFFVCLVIFVKFVFIVGCIVIVVVGVVVWMRFENWGIDMRVVVCVKVCSNDVILRRIVGVEF